MTNMLWKLWWDQVKELYVFLSSCTLVQCISHGHGLKSGNFLHGELIKQQRTEATPWRPQPSLGCLCKTKLPNCLFIAKLSTHPGGHLYSLETTWPGLIKTKCTQCCPGRSAIFKSSRCTCETKGSCTRQLEILSIYILAKPNIVLPSWGIQNFSFQCVGSLMCTAAFY